MGGAVNGRRWVVLVGALGLVGALLPTAAAARPQQQQPAGGEIGVTADTIRIAVIADVDNAGKATGLPDVPVLQTEIAHQCSPISFPVIVVGLDCATKDAGFVTAGVGNQARVSATQIHYRTGSLDKARVVQSYLGGVGRL